jgi:hypothetical protein
LIAQASVKRAAKPLPAKALKMLREICEYNDGARTSFTRVSREDVSAALEKHFGLKLGQRGLNIACAAQLGRVSFAERD